MLEADTLIPCTGPPRKERTWSSRGGTRCSLRDRWLASEPLYRAVMGQYKEGSDRKKLAPEELAGITTSSKTAQHARRRERHARFQAAKRSAAAWIAMASPPWVHPLEQRSNDVDCRAMASTLLRHSS